MSIRLTRCPRAEKAGRTREAVQTGDAPATAEQPGACCALWQTPAQTSARQASLRGHSGRLRGDRPVNDESRAWPVFRISGPSLTRRSGQETEAGAKRLVRCNFNIGFGVAFFR